jgi:hypothetical protein
MALSSATTSHSGITSPPRRLMPLPTGMPSAALSPMLDGCNALLASMPPQGHLFDRLRDCDDPSAAVVECELLRHNLSASIDVPPIDFSALIAVEQREALLYQLWRSNLPPKLHLADIKHLNALATGGDGDLRKTPAYLASHDGRTHLPMVDWRQAHQRLSELPTLLNEGTFGDGLLAAARILALVNNAHAFVDGNGRLGRFLFNYCLHFSGMPATSYLPLKSLAALSRGGYEIRLREAELFGHWDGLVTYHCHAVRLVHQWGQVHATRRRNGSGTANVQ